MKIKYCDECRYWKTYEPGESEEFKDSESICYGLPKLHFRDAKDLACIYFDDNPNVKPEPTLMPSCCKEEDV